MAKLHMLRQQCPNAGPDAIDPNDLAAVYAAHLHGDTCAKCNFNNRIGQARRDNEEAARTEFSRLGHMAVYMLSLPFGAKEATIVWADGPAPLDDSACRTLAYSLNDVCRTLNSRESIEKRVSEPECAERGCHKPVIGWLNGSFDEYEHPDTHKARRMTPAELERCEAHQPKQEAA